ncbi:MAG TPA: NlpC/P60 family protein [Limnochordales bacterium]|nr:NlpC/P60 family protein [Limnochordales bacterium]
MKAGMAARLPALLALLAMLVACGEPDWQHRHGPVTEAEAQRALEWALTQLGAPYRWGGREPPAFDSSGIITWSYRQALGGLQLRYENQVVSDLPHRHIYRWNFQPLPLEELVPGDLVYLTDGTAEVTHGALFVRWVEPYTRMEFLDASTRLGRVVIQEWPVHAEVRGQRLVAAGRLKVVR